MEIFEILWWVLVSHFIGDWGLQNRWMAENKNKYWEILFAHCMIYTGCISMALKYIDMFQWQIAVSILFGHYTVDMISSKWSNKTPHIRIKRYILWIDHLSHFLWLFFTMEFYYAIFWK